MAIPLVLISSKTKSFDCYREEVSSKASPRIDYLEIAARLGGQVYGYDPSRGGLYKRANKIEKRLKLDIMEAFFAATHSSNYTAFLSTSEKTGMPLSVFMAFKQQKKPHILIGHHFSSGNKKRFFRYWRPSKYLSQIICVSQAQADFVVKQMDYPGSRVSFIYDKVDQNFFYPNTENPDGFILAVGQEQRDFETLLKAVAGTKIRLVVVASSPWSTFTIKVQNPKNVTVLSNIPFIQLRDLYARARLVVVPLFNVDYAAGANTALEAMSMAKPLILSRSLGIRNYVVDGETGVFSTPENPVELREKILDLWDKPAEQRRLGSNARQAVEESMTLDIYVAKVVEIFNRALG